MRLRPAEGPAHPRPQALILGPRLMAELIAEELVGLGLEPVLECNSSFDIPSPEGPDALERLKLALRTFQQSSTAARGGVIHPGSSPWADRPELPVIGQELGLVVISPPAKVLSLFANKLNLLHEAERLGVPHLLVSFDPIHSLRELENLINASKLKFPFVLKSVRGNSRSGLMVVQDPADLAQPFSLWVEQVRRNTGGAVFFVERALEGARHLVVPFVRLPDGNLTILPRIDASLQSGFRKIIEFCPATGVDAEIDESILKWTETLAHATGFVGVGLLEFLVDGSRAFLVEGSARLNTGFRLWSRIAGVSAPALQLAALTGSPIPKLKRAREWETGVSLRIHAEDPLMRLPQPGFVHEVCEKREWRFPGAVGELDLSVRAGEELSIDSDELIGVLTVGARDRKQAMTVARGILDELWISGGLQTNERFLSELLLHPWVREGIFHAGFVDEEFIPEMRPSPELTQICATLAALADPDGPKNQGQRWIVGDRRAKPDPAILRWVDGPHAFDRGVSGAIELADGRKVKASAFRLVSGRWQVRVGAWAQSVRRAPISLSAVEGSGPLAQERAAQAKTLPARLFSLVPGRVHSLLFQQNAVVPAHEPLIIVESMRRLIPHSVPVPVTVQEWKVRAEDEVSLGQDLAALLPSES